MDDAPMRILEVLRAPVGGLFRHVSDLTRELSARGHAIGLVVDSLRSDALTAERLEGLAPYASLGTYSLPMPRLVGRQDLTTPLGIRRIATRLNIQIVHGHGAKGGLGARLACWRHPERASLYTPHGGVLNYPPDSLSGRLFRAVERGLLPLTDAIVFESAYAQRAFGQQVAIPRCPTPVIHNGVAPAEFEAITPGADAADFVFIGEFRQVKGIGFLLEALVTLRRPDGRPATLVMAGDGPDRAAVEAQIAALGLHSRVVLLGAQPARPTLARGRCLVVSSLAESLPFVILEAAAAGRPVIATNVGGIGEIFGPTADSLVPAADSGALGAAMQAVHDDPAAAEAEAAARLAFIAPRFSIAHMVDQIEGLYRRVLTRR
jgi:glycosyltransferase involved in cell wall biosynthesis